MKGAKQLAMVKQAQANAELHIGVLPRQGAVFMDLMDFRLTLTPFEARAVAGCLMEKADSARMVQAELNLVFDDNLGRRDPAAHSAIAEALAVANSLEQALLRAMNPRGFLAG
jgi:hypothetical protein